MKKVSNYAVAKEVGKKIVKGALAPVKFFYAFPTFLADDMNKEGREDWNYANTLLCFYCSTVFFPFLTGLGNQMIFGTDNNKMDHFLTGAGICLATNAASGVYEIYKHTKNEMQEKLEETSGEGLEDCVINS